MGSEVIPVDLCEDSVGSVCGLRSYYITVLFRGTSLLRVGSECTIVMSSYYLSAKSIPLASMFKFELHTHDDTFGVSQKMYDVGWARGCGVNVDVD